MANLVSLIKATIVLFQKFHLISGSELKLKKFGQHKLKGIKDDWIVQDCFLIFGN